MKKEIKNPETFVKYIIWIQWKPTVSVVKKIMRKKIQMLDKLNKIGQSSYQIGLFTVRKNWFYKI